VDGDESDLRGFAQEVRRCAPFFPVIGGRALRPVQWRGIDFPAGSWVMLDLFATNRDERLWADPLAFRPERFRAPGAEHAVVAQGGGDYADGHRCPGEPATVELIEAAVQAVVRTDHRVPPQDLRVNLGRFPALPASGYLMAPAA